MALAIAGERQSVADLACALGAKWSVPLIGVDRLVHHDRRHVQHSGYLVIGKRGVGHLAAVKVHLLEHREAELHQAGAGDLRLHDARIDLLSAIDDIDDLASLTWPVSVSTSTSTPAPPTIQNGVTLWVRPVAGAGGT